MRGAGFVLERFERGKMPIKMERVLKREAANGKLGEQVS
jgi:hypothetical protein